MKNFPEEDINYIRMRTNGVVHAVEYNEDAKERFLSPNVQFLLMNEIYLIALWLNDNIRYV